MKAADKGHTEIVNLLLNNGADVNHGDNVRKIHFAIYWYYLHTCSYYSYFYSSMILLLCVTTHYSSYPIIFSLCATKQNDFAALLLAAKAGRADTVQALLAHPAVLVNRVDKVLICIIREHLVNTFVLHKGIVYVLIC